jgi:hypothetical protein
MLMSLNEERPCTQQYNYARHIYYLSASFVIIKSNGTLLSMRVGDMGHHTERYDYMFGKAAPAPPENVLIGTVSVYNRR